MSDVVDLGNNELARRVVIANDPGDSGGAPVAGTLALTTTASAALGDQACSEVLVQNPSTNAVDVLVGDATTRSIRLRPGEGVSIPCTNVSQVTAANASSATQTIGWVSTP